MVHPGGSSARSAAAGAALCAVLAGIAGAQPATRPAEAPLDKAVGLQLTAKGRYEKVIAAMDGVALKLEKTDPETAARIASAAQKAREALIAKDMDKVIEFLRAGLVIPADATQARVIKHLQTVLDTLRGTGEDLEARVVRLERMKQIESALKELLFRQRVLERQSYGLAYGQEVSARLADAARRAAELARVQRDLAARTANMSVGPLLRRLTTAGQAVGELLRRHETLARGVEDPFPTPDAMATNITAVRMLRETVQTAKIEIRTTINDAEVAPKLAAAGADGKPLVEEVGKAADELGKAAEALGRDELKDGQVAVAEAGAHLKAALAAMAAMSGKLAGPAGEKLIADQQAMVKTAGDLAELIEKDLLPPAEGKSAPTGVFKPEELEQRKPAQPLAGVMAAATAALAAFDRESAAMEQQRALEVLGEWSRRLAQERQNLAALKRDPQYPAQRAEQDKIAAGVAQASRGEIPGLPPVEAAEKAITLPGETNVMLASAAAHAEAAAGHLAKEAPAPANAEQKQVIELLDLAIEQLKLAILGESPVLLKELMQGSMAYLERMVMLQKMCLAETIETHAKVQPDGTYRRAEQLRCLAIGRLEAEISKAIDGMDRLEAHLIEIGETRDMPSGIQKFILKMVRRDVDKVVVRLNGFEPGPETQQIEKDILARLEGLLKAIMSSEQTPQPPPDVSEHIWRDARFPAVKRTDLIQMAMVLQDQINSRTKMLRDAAAAGRMPPDKLRAEAADLAAQQQEVAKVIAEMVAKDLQAEGHGLYRKGGWGP